MLADSRWDYIIIGAGSAGSVLANRLSADPNNRVLLLEAGRSDHHPYTRVPVGQMMAIPHKDMNWHYPADADPSRGNREEIWPAGKVLGGGGSINGMMYVRPPAYDFNLWSQLGALGWDYESVLPYFKRMEKNEAGEDKWRGGDGPLHVCRPRITTPLNKAFIDAAMETGIPFNEDLNGASNEGVGYCQTNQKEGWRHSAYQAYVRPVKSRQNLHVVTHAEVTRILLKERKATGVVFRHKEGSTTTYAENGVILSAGAIASPKILMLSGIGNPEELGRHGIDIEHVSLGVGQNLQEHPGSLLGFHVNVPTATSDAYTYRSIGHLLNYVFHQKGPLSTSVGHAHAFVKTRDHLETPNIQIIFSPFEYMIYRNRPVPYYKPAVSFAVGLCRVQSRGSITLRSSNPVDNPRIQYALLSVQDDVNQLVEGVKMARQISQAPSFQAVCKEERYPGLDCTNDEDIASYVREQSILMYHPSGTCKIGQDEMGVVDETLCVRGIENLWVADASVMPTVPAGNINACCMMIGEKASDHILAAA